MNRRKIDLEPEWLIHLQSEFEQEYMLELSRFLRSEKAAGRIVYPAGKDIFTALNTTPLSKVAVVILGQDPYHGPGQAHGLSFSVPDGVPIPPSLKNIYQEIVTDVGGSVPENGNLSNWASQGVLLLNSVLTVRQAQPASHRGKGWERFTDRVIETVSGNSRHVVFMLWGAYAAKKGQSIDRNNHLVLNAPHPSPLSAHRGFFGCRHFSRANSYLASVGRAPIDWKNGGA
ncbi:MAG: uracil-DNA glycosylase [Gammaproteobacteria bacterium]|nr:uracil-DNA glycosylase [Gammaproteobacteria bacterium]